MNSIFDLRFAADEGAGWFDIGSGGVFLSHNAPEAIQALWKGEEKGGEENWRRILRDHAKDENTLVRCAHYITVLSHEEKHFHDLVGTSVGLYVYTQKLIYFMEFVRLMQLLKDVPKVFFPLKKWTRDSSCPEVVRKFVDSYSKEDDFLEWFMGWKGWEIELEGKNLDILSVVAHPNNGLLTPALLTPKGQNMAYVCPIGGLAVFEASAVATQCSILDCVIPYLGHSYMQYLVENTLNSNLSTGWPYVALEFVVRDLFKRRLNPMEVALICDYSLMSNMFLDSYINMEPHDIHPGFRFMCLAQYLSRTITDKPKAKSFETFINNFEDTIDRFDKNRQFSTKAAIESLNNRIESLVSSLRKSQGTENAFFKLAVGYQDFFKKVYDFRLKYPKKFGNLSWYLSAKTNTDLLPIIPYIIGPFGKSKKYILKVNNKYAIYMILFYALNKTVNNLVLGESKEYFDKAPSCPFSELPVLGEHCSSNPTSCQAFQIASQVLGYKIPPSIVSTNCFYDMTLSVLGLNANLTVKSRSQEEKEREYWENIDPELRLYLSNIIENMIVG